MALRADLDAAARALAIADTELDDTAPDLGLVERLMVESLRITLDALAQLRTGRRGAA